MKQILRSILDVGNSVPQEQLIQNLQRLAATSYEWSLPEEKRIYEYATTFFKQRLEVPSNQILLDWFEKMGDVECYERVKDLESVTPYVRSNFAHLLDEALEEQRKIKAIALLRQGQDIISKGLEIEKEKLRGVRDGMMHVVSNMQDLIAQESNAKLRGDLRLDGKEFLQEYEDSKNNQSKAWGCFTGLEQIDTVCQGAKRGELWIHAAYPGELKCVTGDTIIYDHAKKRRRTVADIFESGDLPIVTALDREGETFKLVEAQVSHVLQNGVRDTWTLTLSSGKQLNATSNHKVYTPSGWVELCNLSTGDWVAVPKKMNFEGTHEYSDAEVKFVGYLLGDGTIAHDIILTATKKAIREDFKSCLRSMGIKEGTANYIEPSFHERFPDKRAPYIRVSRSKGKGNSPMVSPAKILLDKLHLYGKDAYSKVIPSSFFELPEDQICLLLGALWSTDGSGHVGREKRKDRPNPTRRTDISYSSVSHPLCLGIQTLLLRLGIQSSVTETRTTYQGVPYKFHCVKIVQRVSKRVFAERITVVGKEKTFAKIKNQILTVDDAPIPTQFIPRPSKIWYNNKRYRYVNHTRDSIQTTTAKLFSHIPQVKKCLEGDITWEKVKSVLFRGQEMTYDLSVPTHHSFAANDIITHNTTFALNWCYNLCTRYHSNVFYVSLEMPYHQLRKQAYVMHSSAMRFRNKGRKPLDYRGVRNGTLTPEEEEYLKELTEDFNADPNYCSFEVWAPDEEVNIDDIRMQAELLNKQMDLGFLVIDHGQLVEPRKKKRSKDYVVELNSVVRDCKRLALHFDKGRGIPVLLLFQINRQGKDAADKADGRYKMSALNYSNECIFENTLISTKRGFFPIKDVTPGQDVVWSRSGWKEVLNKFDNGVKPVFTVRTNNGISLTATSNHRIRILENEQVQWRYLRDIKIGDVVLSDFGYHGFSENSINLPPLRVTKSETSCTTPSSLNVDLAYLMGAFTGDGRYLPQRKLFGYTGNRLETHVRDRIMKSFTACFDQDMHLYEFPSRPGAFDMVANNTKLFDWVTSVGMDRKPGIPESILKAPYEMVCAYLQGVFDTDGSINIQGVIALGLKASNLLTLQHIQLLLSGLGIDSSIKQDSNALRGKKFLRQTLRIKTRNGRAKFHALIGFTEPHKAKRLAEFVEKHATSHKAADRTEWPVFETFARLARPYKGTGEVSRKVIQALKKQRVSHGALEDLLKVADPTLPDAIFLKNLLDTTRPTKVVSIEPAGTARVFDLEVTGDHEYSTGGLFSHNCEKSADVITTTYLNDEHRKAGTTLFCNLKNRDNPQFEPFQASVHFPSRRLFNMGNFSSHVTVEDHAEIMNLLGKV